MPPSEPRSATGGMGGGAAALVPVKVGPRKVYNYGTKS